MREKPKFPGCEAQVENYRLIQDCLAGTGGFEPRYGELEIGRSRPSERSRRNLFSLNS
jgi:hypothetical protein